MQNIIEFNNVKKQFDERTVLDGVDLSVKQGEIFGLLGPSGAGKTTIIKLLTGQLKKSSGIIKVNGMVEKYFTTEKFKENTGILSDNSALYERLTIYDNLKLYCKLYGTSVSRIDEILIDVNLSNESDKVVMKLSKGMKQRVLLAKALIHRPQLLFLDEPTSSLDPSTTFHIHRTLKQLNEAGITIFLTTHNMDEATKLCDRVAFLDQGLIKEVDTPKALQYKYSTHKFHLELLSGETIELENHPKNAEKIKRLIEKDNIKSMFTDNPTLGDVFLSLTGKGLM